MVLSSIFKLIAFVGIIGALSSCSILPQVGPNKPQIFRGSVTRGGNSYVLGVTDRVVRIANRSLASGFGVEFRNAGAVVTDTIRSGDTLVISVYENVEAGVLGTVGLPSILNDIQVDRNGNIFIPYAGLIHAEGKTPDSLRRILTARLAAQTPDPQVIVRRAAGDGASVTIIGTAIQGVYPIEQATSRLTSMLAKAGGVLTEPEATRVTVIRGNRRGSVWLYDLYKKTEQDILLRPGDKVIIEEDIRRFSVLGAISTQGLVNFPKPEMSVLEAISFVGGLSGASSDPSGVFLLREENASVANSILGRNDIVETVRIAYVLDLNKVNGLFLARDFQIRDGDTLYITEAPYYQFTKILTSLITPISSISSISK